jgi:hypothetical protein
MMEQLKGHIEGSLNKGEITYCQKMANEVERANERFNSNVKNTILLSMIM